MRGWRGAATESAELTPAVEPAAEEETEWPEERAWWVLSRRLRLRLRFSLCRLLSRTMHANVIRLLRLLLR